MDGSTAAAVRHSGRPNIETVARRAGVSRQTVSNALNAPHRLAEETLQRVLAAVAELGYRPHAAARSLRRAPARCVAFRIKPIAEGFNGPLFDQFFRSFAADMRSDGYDVRPVLTPWGEAEATAYEELFRAFAIDAAVLTELRRDDPRPARLRAAGVPFVAFGRPWGADLGGYRWVDVDGADGTAQAVDHCVARGHREIAFLGWNRGASVSDDRRAGWETALKRHGLPAARSAHGGPDTPENGRRLAEQLLADSGGRPNPTALVCVSDSLALGALQAVRAAGLTPGIDVAVIGFDDTPTAAVMDPPLTTVRQPIEQCARVAAELLLAELAEPGAPPSSRLLRPRLVVRASG